MLTIDFAEWSFGLTWFPILMIKFNFGPALKMLFAFFLLFVFHDLVLFL